MNIKIKIVSFITLLTAFFAVSANAEDVSVLDSNQDKGEVLYLKDCSDLSNKHINELTDSLNKCIEEGQKTDNAQQKTNDIFFENVGGKSSSLVNEYYYIFQFIGAIFIGFHIARMMFGDEQDKTGKNKSINLMKLAGVAFMSVLLASPTQLNTAVKYLGDLSYKNILNIPSLFNAIERNSEIERNIIITSLDADILSKSEEVIQKVEDSLICGSEYEQQVFSYYGMEDNIPWGDDPKLSCYNNKYNKYIELDMFKDLNGKTASGLAAEECAKSYQSKINNCGSIAFKNNTTIDNIESKKAINEFQKNYSRLLNKYYNSYCSYLQSKGDSEDKLESYCKIYVEPGEFKIRGNDSNLNDIHIEINSLKNNFNLNLKNSIASSVPSFEDLSSGDESNSISLLSVIDQFYNILFKNTFDVEIKTAALDRINNITTENGEFRDLGMGYTQYERKTGSNYIVKYEDYFDEIKSKLKVTNPSRKDATSILNSGIFYDPKTLVGSYTSPRTKEGYKLDFNVFKTFSDNIIDIASIGVGLYVTSQGVMHFVDSKANPVLAQFATKASLVGKLLILASMTVYFTIFYFIIIFLISFLELLVVSVLSIIIKSFMVVFVKKEIQTVIDEVIDFIMNSFILSASIVLTIIFMHLLTNVVVIIFENTIIGSTQNSFLINAAICAIVIILFMALTLKTNGKLNKYLSQKLQSSFSLDLMGGKEGFGKIKNTFSRS